MPICRPGRVCAHCKGDRDFGRDFLLEFQDKLLFGRDYFDTQLMDFLRTLELPAEAFDKIAYQNAERLLSSYLDGPV